MFGLPGYMITILTIIFAVFVFWVWCEMKRKQFRDQSEKMMLVEMWPESGMVTENLYPFKGKEIFVHEDAKKLVAEEKKNRGKNSNNGTIPRYFFDKDCVGTELWPYKSGFMKFLSVQVGKVVYFEGNPEPMSQKMIQVVDPEDQKLIWISKNDPIATPELLGAYRNETFALWSAIYDAEIDALKKQLLKALATKINPTIVYAAMGVSAIGVCVCGFLIYQVMQQLDEIKLGMGI